MMRHSLKPGPIRTTSIDALPAGISPSRGPVGAQGGDAVVLVVDLERHALHDLVAEAEVDEREVVARHADDLAVGLLDRWPRSG